MTLKTAIEQERDERMRPFLPWFRGEPCIALPLDAVKINKERDSAYITLADLAKAFADGEHAPGTKR